MVYSNKRALANARKQRSNIVGTCQLSTRNWYGAQSAGDQDRDGDSDANDGWLSEPVSARVPGDRKPPPGAPLYFKNADGTGFGHRCISEEGDGETISTDMRDGQYTPGVTGKATIDQIEHSMGLVYVGWSRTITGNPIPGLEKKDPKPPKTNRGVRVEESIDATNESIRRVRRALNNSTKSAQKATDRQKHLTLALAQLNSALKNLLKVPPIK